MIVLVRLTQQTDPCSLPASGTASLTCNYLSFFLLEFHEHQMSPLFIFNFRYTESWGESCVFCLSALLHLLLLYFATFSSWLLANILLFRLPFLEIGALTRWNLCKIHFWLIPWPLWSFFSHVCFCRSARVFVTDAGSDKIEVNEYTRTPTGEEEEMQVSTFGFVVRNMWQF